MLGASYVPTSSRSYSKIQKTEKKPRFVQFKRNVQGNGNDERAPKLKHAVSNTTSIDSDSELIPAKESMTPIEREIVALVPGCP
jgi:hypothetical protein